jgi:hypothetical protein
MEMRQVQQAFHVLGENRISDFYFRGREVYFWVHIQKELISDLNRFCKLDKAYNQIVARD